jgi:hypothetical protein
MMPCDHLGSNGPEQSKITVVLASALHFLSSLVAYQDILSIIGPDASVYRAVDIQHVGGDCQPRSREVEVEVGQPRDNRKGLI